MSKQFCDHMCTSMCRNIGCNCECGEYHNEDGIYEDDEEETDPILKRKENLKDEDTDRHEKI